MKSRCNICEQVPGHVSVVAKLYRSMFCRMRKSYSRTFWWVIYNAFSPNRGILIEVHYEQRDLICAVHFLPFYRSKQRISYQWFARTESSQNPTMFRGGLEPCNKLYSLKLKLYHTHASNNGCKTQPPKVSWKRKLMTDITLVNGAFVEESVES